MRGVKCSSYLQGRSHMETDGWDREPNAVVRASRSFLCVCIVQRIAALSSCAAHVCCGIWFATVQTKQCLLTQGRGLAARACLSVAHGHAWYRACSGCVHAQKLRAGQQLGDETIILWCTLMWEMRRPVLNHVCLLGPGQRLG